MAGKFFRDVPSKQELKDAVSKVGFSAQTRQPRNTSKDVTDRDLDPNTAADLNFGLFGGRKKK